MRRLTVVVACLVVSSTAFGQAQTAFLGPVAIAQPTVRDPVHYKLEVNGDANINFVTIGRGGGSSTWNTALGTYVLAANTTGSNNTAAGAYPLLNNLTGSNNTANGALSLLYNTAGNENTSVARTLC